MKRKAEGDAAKRRWANAWCSGQRPEPKANQNAPASRSRSCIGITKRFLARLPRRQGRRHSQACGRRRSRTHRDVPVFCSCAIRSCRPDGLGACVEATDSADAGGDGRRRGVRGEALSRRRTKTIEGNTITRNLHSKETSNSLKIIYLNGLPRFW